jgi:uncharacterized protein (TIGR02145 family)
MKWFKKLFRRHSLNFSASRANHGELSDSVQPQKAMQKEMTDIDGNVYQTIKIGDQVWMAENLKVTRYRNGDPIRNWTDKDIWAGLTTGAYCNYNNDENNATTYGRLYNWYAIGIYDEKRKIAPVGWHVPSDDEWQILINYLGGDAVAGTKMKEAGTAHWNSPNAGTTNESGFSALPGGCRDYNGNYLYLGLDAAFWSSTTIGRGNAWGRSLFHDDSQKTHLTMGQLRAYAAEVQCCSHDWNYGFAVRCIKN